MKVAYINPKVCDQSPACPARRSCPQKAITQDGKGVWGFMGGGTASVDPEKCTGCGLCVKYCPTGAIKMKEV